MLPLLALGVLMGEVLVAVDLVAHDPCLPVHAAVLASLALAGTVCARTERAA